MTQNNAATSNTVAAISAIVNVSGFDAINRHRPEMFWAKFGNVETVMAKARDLISGNASTVMEENSFPKSGYISIRHGYAHSNGWKHVGCLGQWGVTGDMFADMHCLEVMRAPDNRYFIVMQVQHDDVRSRPQYYAETSVIAEVPTCGWYAGYEADGLGRVSYDTANGIVYAESEADAIRLIYGDGGIPEDEEYRAGGYDDAPVYRDRSYGVDGPFASQHELFDAVIN